MLTFTGNAPAGQYFIYLMAEDRIPVPKMSHVTDNNPLSAVPVHLSLTGGSVNQRIVINLAYMSANKLRLINQSIKQLQLHEHLSFCLLPVEESTTSCSAEPVAVGNTPEEDSTLFVLPYEEVKFNIKYMSRLERFVTSFECLHFECGAPCSAPIHSHSSVEEGPPERWQLLLCDPSPVSHDAK